jgi:anti-anti-sigma factor
LPRWRRLPRGRRRRWPGKRLALGTLPPPRLRPPSVAGPSSTLRVTPTSERRHTVGVEVFRLERGDTPAFFHLIGELDLSNVEEVRAQLEEELERSDGLTLDTAHLKFMDSQGLRMLIDLGEQAHHQGSTVKVVNCSGQLRRLLDIAVPQGLPGVEVIYGE